MSRRDDALWLAEFIGPNGLVIDDAADGWLALGTMVALREPIGAALFEMPIDHRHRNRDDIRAVRKAGASRRLTE